MRIHAVLLAIAFLTLTLCSVGAFMHADHAMGTCQFAPQLVALCPPGTGEQLVRLVAFVIALAATLAVLRLPGFIQQSDAATDIPPDTVDAGVIRLPLELAFSDGLIQPKVFGF